MLHGVLQVEFDGADVDPETSSNLAVGQLFNMGRYEYLPPAGWQFCQRLIQLLDLKPGANDLRGIRAFIGNVGDGSDLGGTEEMGVASAPVLRDIDRGAKEIVGRAVYGHRLRDALDA